MLSKFCTYLITAYQKSLSSWLPGVCRYQPSCSEYAKQAFSKYGFFGGSWRSIKRILRCHPFSKKSGYDPLI